MGRRRQRETAELTARLSALAEFNNALAKLIDMADHDPDPWSGRASLAPRKGREGEWTQARAEVDRLAPKATRAFLEAGIVMAWKPPGTPPGTQIPIDPAFNWSTVLDPYPRFSAEALFACIAQARGALEDRIEHPFPRERTPIVAGHSVMSATVENCAFAPGENCAVFVGGEFRCWGCRRWL